MDSKSDDAPFLYDRMPRVLCGLCRKSPIHRAETEAPMIKTSTAVKGSAVGAAAANEQVCGGGEDVYLCW